jgi:threonine synthase
METTHAFAGLACRDCGASHPAATFGGCPDCDGPLSAVLETDGLTRETFAGQSRSNLGRFERVLPFGAEQLVDLAAGGTPLVAVPGLADDLGVDGLAVKDEGRNPTGALADRYAALAVTAAREGSATDVALPSPGNGAQSVAAAAARVGLDSHAFVPSRTPFVNKAMINVHGGDMTVVPGRYDDAALAYAEAAQDEDWFPAGDAATAYPLDGAKTVAYELVLQRDWGVPDAVVVPVAHGTGLVGLAKGFQELLDGGLLDAEPRLYGVQPAGCAPVVTSWEGAGGAVTPVDTPDTICGELEIPSPGRGGQVLSALEGTGGGAVAPTDEAILEAATGLAEAGLTASVSGGAALAGARELAGAGVLDRGADVVLVNPLSGNKEADILRSHLMRKGI